MAAALFWEKGKFFFNRTGMLVATGIVGLCCFSANGGVNLDY
jgi:hypothetical protein